MKIKKLSRFGKVILTMAVLLLACGSSFAADKTPMTPELAAKKENFRKQDEQRITPEKRKAATEALKAERIKIYKAKQAAEQAAEQLAPVATENK